MLSRMLGVLRTTFVACLAHRSPVAFPICSSTVAYWMWVKIAARSITVEVLC